ncbi:MAG: efflux RND transporter periplasmic adaptor subunit [Oscillospiraceae bacterium]|nr:efflux RND transporter periplasmic adaptor subunit [Oscillospiraceae bacterium]
MSKVKNVFSKAAALLRRRKWIFLAGLLIAAAAVTALCLLLRGSPRTPMDFSPTGGYVRTTILQKTSLENTVSAKGTVESSSVSTVTSSLKYPVKEILVQVGDQVKEGDVICRLDASALEEQIEKLEKNLKESKEQAQANYEKAQSSATAAYDKAAAQESVYNAAKSAFDSAQAAYNTAKATISSLQQSYDAAAAEAAGAAANAAAKLDAYNAAYSAYLAAPSAETANAAYQAAQEVAAAYAFYNGAAVNVPAVSDGQFAGISLTGLDGAGGKAAAEKTALEALQNAKNLCGYDEAERNYQNAQTAMEQARAQLDNLESQYTSAKEQLENAKTSLEKSASSDELESLRSQLDDCTLTANSSGTVTSLNATVGSTPVDGAIAVIQDTEKLKLSISVPEYDIGNIKVGQTAHITSDATGDAVITGKVTQVSKTAASGGNGSSSGFACEITIENGANGLLIGMNAKANILLSSKDNVFVVPIDAVGTDTDGGKVVYVKTSGQGANAVFEPVPVTTGEENDYYIEISGDGLEEGMEVRSSADPEEALVSGAEENAGAPETGFMVPAGEGGYAVDIVTGPAGGGAPPSGGPGGER